MNFLLGQWKDAFIPVLRTEQKLQGIKIGIKEALKKDERTQFLINYDGRRLFLCQDGISKNYREVGPLSFSNWNRTYPLVVGTDSHGRSQWKGVLHEIAVFDIAMTPEEVQRFKGSGVQGKEEPLAASHKPQGRTIEHKRPLIHYVFKQENTYETEFRGGKALGVRDLGKGEAADLVMPEQFAPYQRVYLGWDPDWMKNRSDWLDLAVNILGFIPFGALLFVQSGKWVLGIGKKPQATSHKPQGNAVERQGFGLQASGIGIENGNRASGFRLRDNNGEGIDKTRLAYIVILTVVVGFVVSFAIEWLQAYLPSRDSSMRDLITNGLGTFIGAIVAAYLLKRARGSGQWTVASDAAERHRKKGIGLQDSGIGIRECEKKGDRLRLIENILGESAAGKIDLKRGLLFVAVVAGLMLYGPVREYLYWTYKSAYYTHVVLIPFVFAYLVFTRRREIFEDVGYAFAQGGAVAGLGLLLLAAAAALAPGWSKNDACALVACATVLVVIGSFIALFGLRAFRSARFALLFLAFMVPLPTVVEYWVIRVLQLGSAEFVAFLFPFTGMPVLRDVCVFHLPGISIEVAPQCSGIRSSLALVITCVLAGHMFLKTTWKKILLVLLVLPVTMLKNGIRIVTLSVLAVYVDRGFLESSLHRDGGIVFFILALCLMAPILLLLRRSEK